MTAPAAIAFEAVSRTYGGRPALDDVSSRSRKGEFLAIVGPSGSGKTTLLRLINRLADPTSGTVQRRRRRCAPRSIRSHLRRRIGYVFQGVGLFPHLTVAENIAITPKLLGWDAARRKARANELLALVRLDESYLRALSRRTVRRRTPARRHRAGACRAACHRADGRAVLRARSLTRDALGEEYRQLHETLGLPA